MRPLFSATSTRPSGRKRSVEGWSSPSNTTASEKPGCLKVVAAKAGAAAGVDTAVARATAARRTLAEYMRGSVAGWVLDLAALAEKGDHVAVGRPVRAGLRKMKRPVQEHRHLATRVRVGRAEVSAAAPARDSLV